MLTATGLSCVRGERRLFSGLDFAVGPGEWLHLQGENGAGKTSLLRMVVGLTPPAEGTICWQGHDIHGAAEDYRRDLTYLGHHAAVKDDLTALENLRLAGELDGNATSTRDAMAALGRMGLKGREALPVRVLSQGQKRRVLLARLLTRQARLWVLDEPFTALDVKAVDLLAGLIAGHLAEGGMAVLTSHQNMPIGGGRVLAL